MNTLLILFLAFFAYTSADSVQIWPSQQICTGQYAQTTPCCCVPGNSYYLYALMMSFDLSSIPAGATVTSAILSETVIYTQGPANLITSSLDVASISGYSYNNQPPRLAVLDTRQAPSTGYLQTNEMDFDVTTEVNRVLGIGRPLNIIQYNNAGMSFNYDFVELFLDTGNIGYSSPSQQPHLTITYSTAPPPGADCVSDGDCVPYSGNQPYATCNNGHCQCLPSFSGFGTTASPCSCPTNNVQWDSQPHCLSPGQCISGRQDLCASVSDDYNFVTCGTDNKCHCNAGFSGAATASSHCTCTGTVSWVNNVPHCLQPGTCTSDDICAPFSQNFNFVHCGSDGMCHCNDGFSGDATITSLCGCNGQLGWDNGTATCTPNA